LGRRRYHLALLLTAALAAVMGCGLFDLRDPRPTDTTVPPARCRLRTTPDSVLANIVVHYGTRTSCYGEQLDTGFVFVPDPQDYIEEQNPGSPNPFDGWNRDTEIGVSERISTDADTVVVSFDSTYAAPSTSTNPTRETRYYYYHLLLVGNSADTTRYQGQAEVTFIQRAITYTLERFVDHRDGSTLPTWGSLRADKSVGQ